MKRILFLSLSLIGIYAQAQQTTQIDTTRFNMGENEVIIVSRKKIADTLNSPMDTIDAAPDDDDFEKEGHWGGLDFGPSIMMNSSFESKFPDNPQWQNDPAKSFYWNINIFDRKFRLYKEYIGLTTGFGVNFTQIGIKNNQLLKDNADSLWFVQDTVNDYSKNKLRAVYLQVPLLLEFNTKDDHDHSFYFATGLIGGVRVGSAVIQKIDRDKYENKEKVKGTYALNAFKLDATVRMGYGSWGLFANYALMPLFDTAKTSTVYPFTFGATYNF